MRYPPTTDALSLSHDVHSLYPKRSSVRVPPRKSLGLCRHVTNKGKSGFGKANDRVEAKNHRPVGIQVGVWWGALSIEGRKLDRCSKVIIGFPVSFPSALIHR